MEDFEKKIDMELLETPGEFDTDSERLEVVTRLKQHNINYKKLLEE